VLTKLQGKIVVGSCVMSHEYHIVNAMHNTFLKVDSNAKEKWVTSQQSRRVKSHFKSEIKNSLKGISV